MGADGQAKAKRTLTLGRVKPFPVIVSRHGGQRICAQGEAAEHWYCIVEGAARSYVLEPDGRRQIVGFLLPGDYFGFTANTEFDLTVEAITDPTCVAIYPRRRVEALANSDAELARDIRQMTFEALARLEAHLRILGRVTASEKVACFLVEMAERLSDGHHEYTLPVSRKDIADYLSISVETVSRSLNKLKRHKIITLAGWRSVKLVNRDILDYEQMARENYKSGSRIGKF